MIGLAKAIATPIMELIQNNIGIFQIKEKKSQIEDLTKIFIEKYSLSYSQIIQEFIVDIWWIHIFILVHFFFFRIYYFYTNIFIK